jgi:hypothetical protein
MSNAASRVRVVFQEKNVPLTLKEIKEALQDLQPSQISMALCYHVRQGNLTRTLISNPTPKSRKQVWQYQFHQTSVKQTLQEQPCPTTN